MEVAERAYGGKGVLATQVLFEVVVPGSCHTPPSPALAFLSPSPLFAPTSRSTHALDCTFSLRLVSRSYRLSCRRLAHALATWSSSATWYVR